VNNLFDAVKLNSNHDDENHLKTHEPFKLAYNIINSANDVIIICEAEPIDELGPRIIYVNDNFVRTTGYSVEEVVGKTPRILQGPETNLITLGRMHDALKNWQPICVDVLNYKKSGEAFWVSISIFPVANENGWFTHWVSIQRSIKDNKQHEAELLSSKAKLLTSNQELIFQNEEKASRAAELLVANKELTFQNEEKAKRAAELVIANKELTFQNEEKAKRAAELVIANIELTFQNEEKAKRAAELVIANKELTFLNEEKAKRAAELVIANKELTFQNEEKAKRAAELVIANKELTFQNEEKASRAAELLVANKELTFQNEEKAKRAAETVVANIELTFQNEEKAKRAAELVVANIELTFQNEEKASRAAELLVANKELTFQNEEKASRAAELLVANKELTFQNNEKAKRTAELLILNAAVNKRDSDLRFILENSPIAIRMTSKVNGLLVFVNKRYCDLTGLFPADLIGINPKELYVVEEDYDELSQEQPSDDGMRSKLVKLAFKHKFKWVLTSGIEMEYENEPVSLDWLYEVTEQKKLERTLMDTQKRLNFSFEGSGDGTWDWNTTNGEVIYSRQWKSMIGYSESELKDDFKEWETRVHQDDLAKAVSDIQAYLDGATSRYINEHRLMCKDGNYKWILTRGIITAHNANGEAMRMIGTHTDITPQKDIEHALLIAQSESEQANQAKSRFLAAASHDLRQPLTALTLYVDVLTKRTNCDAAGLGKKIQVCVSSLSGLLDNLLDVSKLEAGVVLPAKSVFKIDDLLSSVVNIHTAGADSKGLRLLLRPTNLVVHTDYTILQRILGNLIVNAISYTNKGGVLVSCRRHNGKQWIEIWDSGVGFPSNMARYIFDEFTQLGDNSRSVGSGLGLAIVSKSANLLGLELRVRSRLGRGSMFAIEIPQGDALQIVMTSEPKVAVDNWIIALVDDNPMVLDATSFALNVMGHEVIVAESESSIFKNLGYQMPDIFISDYRLADNKTGLELVLKAREIFGEDLPVILITGDTDPKLIKLFTKHKIKVCYKPLKMDILNNLISEVMLPC
jgi:PAS domain S-box-containing protein